MARVLIKDKDRTLGGLFLSRGSYLMFLELAAFGKKKCFRALNQISAWGRSDGSVTTVLIIDLWMPESVTYIF